MTGVVVGVDAGGTSTRCLVVDHSGARLATARGPGANLNSSADAEAALRAVLAAALPPGAAVDALVFAAAGAGPAGRPRAVAVATAATRGYAVARLVVHSDVEAAYAAGSVEPDGAVVVAGTGAVAATIEGFRLAARFDGHGYRVGDRGSAYWIGAEGVRAVLAALDGLGPETALRSPLLAQARAGLEARDDLDALTEAELLEAAVYAQPPAALGALAPLVESAAAAGDSVCAGIVRAAVEAVVASAVRAHRGGPLVASGALLTGHGLIATTLRAELEMAVGVAPRLAVDGSAGAAALALRLLPDHEDAARHVVESDSPPS